MKKSTFVPGLWLPTDVVDGPGWTDVDYYYNSNVTYMPPQYRCSPPEGSVHTVTSIWALFSWSASPQQAFINTLISDSFALYLLMWGASATFNPELKMQQNMTLIALIVLGLGVLVGGLVVWQFLLKVGAIAEDEELNRRWWFNFRTAY